MSLINTIKTYFDRAVLSDYNGPTDNHPIVVLNALKNIIGDNRKYPSKIILDLMDRVAKQYPKRIDDKKCLDRVAKEGFGHTIFVSDLYEACQEGKSENMETQAARLQAVSENGLGGLEILIEVALQDFDRLGLLSYHLHRANVFNQDVKNTWTYTRCLLKEIIRAPLPGPHVVVELGSKIKDKVPSDQEELIKMAAARRLWDGNFIRINGIQRELDYWFSTHTFAAASSMNIHNELDNYLKNGGNFFIKLAENLIKYPEWEANVIRLEALRYFSTRASSKQLEIVSFHLKELLL